MFIRDYPNIDLAYTLLIDYYNSRKRTKETIPVITGLLEHSPRNSRGWDMLFEAYQSDSLVSDTILADIISQAHSALPENMKWSYYMSRLWVIRQQPDSALSVLDSGIGSGTEETRYLPALWIMKGDIYTLQEQWDSVFAAYDQALKYDSENAYVLNNYAYMLALHGNDLRRAEQMSSQTIRQEPDNGTYLDTYAWILHLQHQDALAAFYMQKAWEKISEEERKGEIEEHYKIIFGK